MSRILLIFPLVFLSTLIYAAGDFEGTYQCTGFDPYLNKKYRGTVIVKQHNTVYDIQMQYDTGEKLIASGGQYNPTLLSVVFQDVDHLTNVGLEQYTFTPDKKIMAGYWVHLGKDKLGSEICEKA